MRQVATVLKGRSLTAATPAKSTSLRSTAFPGCLPNLTQASANGAIDCIFRCRQLSNDSQRTQIVSWRCEGLSALTGTAPRTDRSRRWMSIATSLRELLEPVDIQSSQASYESYLALRTRLPSDQGISTYYANIHRDWAWGDAENQASLD